MHVLRIVVCLAVLGCARANARGPFATGPHERMVVAADHPLASAAGLEISEQGGNVVDVAVATSFALSVVRPYSCGLGGGGFMLIWDAKHGRAHCLDYRERAPAAATRDMFANLAGTDDERREASRHGGLAVAVPGTVAGLLTAHARHGQLDRNAVLAPAIRLASSGWRIDAHHTAQVRSLQERFAQSAELRQRFAAFFRLYLNDGRPLAVGDRITSPQRTALELIAEHGVDGFYAKDVATSLLQTVRDAGGIWASADLRTVEPKFRRSLRGAAEWGELVLMPPPSSGGVAILQALRTLEAHSRRNEAFRFRRNEPASVHVLAETLKHAFADRARYLGDTDYADVPVTELVDSRRAERTASRIDPRRTLSLREYGHHEVIPDGGTSHVSVVDADGNAVAMTETINTIFGSWVVDPKYGVVLNNEMDDFATRPGKPNAFGLLQSEANAVAPGKKPLSSMSPTILVRDGRAVLAVGASGGPRIITSTLQVLLDVGRDDRPVAEAVAEARFHHQWQPHRLEIETRHLDRLRKPLEDRGHVVRGTTSVGVVQAVTRTPRGLFGASDPRKGGRPRGR